MEMTGSSLYIVNAATAYHDSCESYRLERMRFRTYITNVVLLRKIVQSLAALAKQCIIRMAPDRVYFIVPGNEGRDGVQVWSQVKVVSIRPGGYLQGADKKDTLFSGFRIESNSNNEIWVQLQLEALLKVLRSAETSMGLGDPNKMNATSLQEGEFNLKLNRRPSDGQAVWAFEIRGKSPLHGKDVSITHEINVHVLSAKRQRELTEPLCPPPDMNMVLPNLTELRNIVSRLGHIANDVKVSANLEGTLKLLVQGATAELSTTWTDLVIPSSTADPPEGDQPPSRTQMFSVQVTIRGLLKFLTSHHVGGTAIACICKNHCLIAYVYIGEISDSGGVLTFFIPAKNTGDNYDDD